MNISEKDKEESQDSGPSSLPYLSLNSRLNLRLQSMPYISSDTRSLIPVSLQQKSGYIGLDAEPRSLQVPIGPASFRIEDENEITSAKERAKHSTRGFVPNTPMHNNFSQKPVANQGVRPSARSNENKSDVIFSKHKDTCSIQMCPQNLPANGHSTRVSSTSQASNTSVQRFDHQLPPPTWGRPPAATIGPSPAPPENAKPTQNGKSGPNTSKASGLTEKQTRTILKGKRRCAGNEQVSPREMERTPVPKGNVRSQQKPTAPLKTGKKAGTGSDKPVNHVKPIPRVENAKIQGSAAEAAKECHNPKQGPSKADSGKKNVDDVTNKLQDTMIKEHSDDVKDHGDKASSKNKENEKEVERQKLAPVAQMAEESLNEIRSENRRLKDAKQCRVCRDKDANRMFLPCAHLCSCNLCSPALRNCPQCKGSIKGIISVYFG